MSRPRLTHDQSVRLLGTGMALDAPGAGHRARRAAGVPPNTTQVPENAPGRVLGLDLAARCTGWCLLVDGRPACHGSFDQPERPRRHESLAAFWGRRAGVLSEQMQILLSMHRPDVVAFEYPDRPRSAWSGGSKGREFQAVHALGRAQGFLVALWPQIGCGARLVAVSTSDAKRTATGRVDSSKEQVRYELWARRQWDLVGWTLDETDAAAIALVAREGIG